MKINRLEELPAGIRQAILKDNYTIGEGTISVSQLNTPPQIRRLSQLFADKLETDVYNKVFSFIGTAVHDYIFRANQAQSTYSQILDAKDYLFYEEKQLLDELVRLFLDGTDPTQVFAKLQDYAEHHEEDKPLPLTEVKDNVLLEKRHYLQLGEDKLSGQQDRVDVQDETLYDYKVTSVWKILKNDYSDWTTAQNMYRLILKHNDITVNKLVIVAILRDWRKSDSYKDPNYPATPIISIELPVWDYLTIFSKIIEKMLLHKEVSLLTDPAVIAERFPCSEDDKWQGKSKYAFVKAGNKRATAVFEDLQEALHSSYASEGNTYQFEERKGTALRCEEYCLAKNFCMQYKKENPSDKIENTVPDVNELMSRLSVPTNSLRLPADTLVGADEFAEMSAILENITKKEEKLSIKGAVSKESSTDVQKLLGDLL